MARSTLILVTMLAGCAQLPMTADPGTTVVRLSKITGSISPSPVGGAHAESCQLVVINGDGVPCVSLSQGDCTVNTCPGDGQ